MSGSADGAILDLEDAVEEGEKPRARDLLVELIKRRQPGGPALFVRVNGLTTAFAYDDLVAVARPGVDGIVLPKTESAKDVHIADWLILQMELKHGLEPGSIRLFPGVETALGLTRIEKIAQASPRVSSLSFGSGDFSLDTGIPLEVTNESVLAGRIRTVVVCRAAGLDAPLDCVNPDLRDTEGFVRDAEQGKRLGFQGKFCIHPAQVDIANRIFSPSPEEVERARLLLSAFEEANRQGSASIQIDGDFVDYPVAQRARRVILLAEQMGSKRQVNR